MHVPCPACGTITRFKSPSSDSTSVLVDCPGCQGRFRVAIQVPETKGDPESYRRAREYAREHDIDIATAYSVLEGLLTLEEARGTSGTPGRDPAAASGQEQESPVDPAQGPSAPPSAAPPSRKAAKARKGVALSSSSAASPAAGSTSPPGRERTSPPSAPSTPGVRLATDIETSEGFSYDAGFAAAVREGCLTAKQAIERGDRHALATRLSTRHSLPMDLAFQTADNRMTIRQAVQQKVARETEGKSPARGSKSSKGGWRLAVYGIGGVLLLVAGMALNVMWQRSTVSPMAPPPSVELVQQAIPPPEAPPPTTPEPPPARTIPKVDHAGQLVEVEGPDPRSVLVSFCDSGALAGQRKPIEIVDTMPASAGWRLGVFSSSGPHGSSMRAIRIRKDSRTSRWTAGDGRTPILTEPFGPEPQAAPAQVGTGDTAPPAVNAASTGG